MLIIIKEAVPAYCQVLRHNRKKIGKVIHDCDKNWFAEKCGVDNIWGITYMQFIWLSGQ